MAISLKSAFHDDRNVIAYRVYRQDIFPVEILEEEGADPEDVKDFNLLLPIGGCVKVDRAGVIRIGSPGLYRLHRLEDNRLIQWIVHDGDVMTLAASASSVFYHQASEPLDPNQSLAHNRSLQLEYAIRSASHGKVGGVCLTSANFFALLCRWLGLNAVVWEFENLTTTLKPFSTHAMTEVYVDALNQPVLFDLDRGMYLLNDLGEILSLEGFLSCVQNGGDITPVPLNSKPYGGYGPGSRIPVAYDFIVDLYQLGGASVDKDFYHSLGMAEVVIGTKAYGSMSRVTTSLSKVAAEKLLNKNEQDIDPAKSSLLPIIQKLPTSDLTRDSTH